MRAELKNNKRAKNTISHAKEWNFSSRLAHNSFEYTSETFHANSSIKINHFRLHIIMPFGAPCHIFKLLPCQGE